MNSENAVRSPGSADPKCSAKYVPTHTAEAGPPGSKLRAKYMRASEQKSGRAKTSGNSGKTGRKYRSYLRGHSGGQISAEEKARRTAQSNAAMAARSSA